MKRFADNCGICGHEYISTDLITIKLARYNLNNVNMCPSCLSIDKAIEDYKTAAELIVFDSAENDK